MTKKSGLADSPFFAIPLKKNEESTPFPPLKPEQRKSNEGENAISQSPTPNKLEDSIANAHQQENQEQKRTFERSNERPIEPSNERLNERPPKQKREKIRHTFDIYKDQLIELQRIQWERVQAGKKKPKLGKMVAEGIDLFIKQQAFKNKRA
jgi:hypothetical protein